MKKILSLIICMILLVGTVSAMTPYEKKVYDSMTNIFSKIRYGFSKGLFLFTSWGEINGCSTYPNWEGWIRGSMSRPTSLPTSVSCSKVGKNKCAIDIWYDNTIYLNNYGPPSNVNWNNWLKEVAGTGVSFSGSTYPYYYIQIYGCPDTPPSTDNWETDVYRCESGSWSYKGDYSKTQSCPYDTSGVGTCWCNDEDENFYIDQSGAVHCVSSPSSSWCPAYIAHYTKQCVASGTTEYLYWYDSYGARNDLIQTCSSTQKCTTNGCVEKETTTSCETMSGTSGRCDSNSITDKKCIGNLVYVCSDYGTAGKCWTNMADCSLSGKICENGECKSTCISLIQLRTYADQWINNQIDRNTLGNYIQNWASCS